MGMLETDHEQWRLRFDPEGKRCQLGFSVAGYIVQRAGNGVKVKDIKSRKVKALCRGGLRDGYVDTQERIVYEDICNRVGVALIEEKLVQHRLRWFGHIQRRNVEGNP